MSDIKTPINLGLKWPIKHDRNSNYTVWFEIDIEYFEEHGGNVDYAELAFDYDFASGVITEAYVDKDNVEKMRIYPVHLKNEFCGSAKPIEGETTVLSYNGGDVEKNKYGFADILTQKEFLKLINKAIFALREAEKVAG